MSYLNGRIGGSNPYQEFMLMHDLESNRRSDIVVLLLNYSDLLDVSFRGYEKDAVNNLKY